MGNYKIVGILIVLIGLFVSTCDTNNTAHSKQLPDVETDSKPSSNTALVLLGTIQDAGSPHIACKKKCCAGLFEKPDPDRQVISLGLYDSSTQKRYLFEATPDISRQVKKLARFGAATSQELPDAIFLTHAHIGHYAGLMYLGKEATDAKQIPVFAMPRMRQFLETNGPWDQLVSRKNIALNLLQHEQSLRLSDDVEVTPFTVPHRDEYSETVGYKIKGPNKSALFIPDIDKWEKWEQAIISEIEKVDYAFLDATFFSGVEINNRDITQIPHPFIIESMHHFEALPTSEKAKVIFIHFNHTNPVINPESEESQQVLENGFRIGRIDEVFEL